MTTATEPRITFNKEARRFEIAYLVGTDHEGSGGRERRHYAVLTVRYNKGGMNYFSGRSAPRCYESWIGRRTEEDWEHGTITGFKLFDGLGLTRSDPVGRYSEKGLREFLPTAREHFEAVRDDPRVARFFEPVEEAAA